MIGSTVAQILLADELFKAGNDMKAISIALWKWWQLMIRVEGLAGVGYLLQWTENINDFITNIGESIWYCSEYVWNGIWTYFFATSRIAVVIVPSSSNIIL